MKILILGVNGFIGNHLLERILETTTHEVYGLDLSDHNIEKFLDHDRFTYQQGDITKSRDWIEEQVQQCDICLPLVAIANPSQYNTDPLGVFRLDFEENLHTIRLCAKYQTRVIFPSTSEVYGMCKDEVFSEETSQLVYGPIKMQRWIYACSKQMLDRVIWAMGIHENLDFTLFRPFNWIGPKLDDINVAKKGGARVMTQFLGNMIRGEDIHLVGGGLQRRCFIYIDEGIDVLMKIIENKEGVCKSKIYNIGNPNNNYSVKELAQFLARILKTYPEYKDRDFESTFVVSDQFEYYGKGYEDIQDRNPDISLAQKELGWTPQITMEDAVKRTIDYYIQQASVTVTS